jgi:hypothetical protein
MVRLIYGNVFNSFMKPVYIIILLIVVASFFARQYESPLGSKAVLTADACSGTYFEITNVCVDEGNLRVTVKNSGDSVIGSFAVNEYRAKDNMTVKFKYHQLGKDMVDWFNVPRDGLVKRIEMTPRITVSGDSTSCPLTMSYGNFNENPIKDCPFYECIIHGGFECNNVAYTNEGVAVTMTNLLGDLNNVKMALAECDAPYDVGKWKLNETAVFYLNVCSKLSREEKNKIVLSYNKKSEPYYIHRKSGYFR